MAKTYNKIYKSNPELLPEIEDFILNIVDNSDVTEITRNNIEMAVAEAAANCIKHGNKNDSSKNVTVNINLNETILKISFTDEGKGFIPEEVPDPTLPENILKGSGRGVHIMNSLVDDLEYIFSDSGTELILTFNI